ncbi:MAG: hypothetical protein JOY62_15470 [Acidobacteriaceae bacterium]|nr:hypothetical protein [Acidobacteriaceae bacterium]MBV9781363.1 hypothetical protein [Acidobacteriaceae bacterium]
MKLHHENPLPVPVERLGAQASRIQQICGVIGVIGLVLCVMAFLFNREEFFQSYSFAFLYWSGFAIGGLGVLLMHHTVGGKWGVTIRRLLEAKMRTLRLVAVLIIPILFGLRYIYPWANHQLVMQTPVLQHKQPYLNTLFFIGRVILYFIVWWFWGFRVNRLADRQDETGDPTLKERMRAFSAPGVLVFTLTGTFAYIDWILSADVQFYSTIYGAMILVGDVLQTLALSIVVLVLASRDNRFGGRIAAPVLHDLGNMMFAFVIFWAYLSASQLIIVWPGNLPQEIGWYLDRVRGFWKYFAAATALSMFAIPFCLLLSQDRKRHPDRLLRVAVFILFARLIDMFWIVEPTHRTKGFALYWTDIAAFLGVGGIWLYVYLMELKRRPLLPLRDPRVAEPMPEVAYEH